MTEAELEKEAEEWVKNNNYPYSSCPNIEKKLKQAYLAGAEPREKRIAELEKENAELQQKWLNESYEKAKLVEKWKRNGENIIQECRDIEGANAYYEHQLTNAKEIIKTLAGDLSMYSGNYQKELLEAKQFLKENSTYERIQKAKYNYTD